MGMLVLFALIIGLLLGLLGGGGSILTVPVLVYWMGFDARQAIVTSLIIVAITSAIACVFYARGKHVYIKIGIAFSTTGVIGAYAGGRLSAFVPNEVLLVLFSLVMLITSITMLRSQQREPTRSVNAYQNPTELPLASILFDGLMVGLITGLVGVGGGFLLVPALNFLVKIPMRSAIGTSLFIVTIQSIAALIGHADHFEFDHSIVATFASCTVVGSLIGGMISRRIDPKWLKKGFGFFVLFVGLLMLLQDLNPETFLIVKTLYLNHQEFVLGVVTALLVYAAFRFRLWLHARGV